MLVKNKKFIKLFMLKYSFFKVLLSFYSNLRKKSVEKKYVMFTFAKILDKSLQFLNLIFVRKFLNLKTFKKLGKFFFRKFKRSKNYLKKKNINLFLDINKLILKIFKQRKKSFFFRFMEKKKRYFSFKKRKKLKKNLLLKNFIMNKFSFNKVNVTYKDFLKKNSLFFFSRNFKLFLKNLNLNILRWRVKEYFFLFNLEKDSSIGFNLKKYFLNYFKLVFLLKLKLNNLKLFLLKFLKNKISLKKKSLNMLNISFILKKYFVLFSFKKNSLKNNVYLLKKFLIYFNKFFNVIYTKLYLKKSLIYNKNIVYNSYIYNVNFTENIISLVSFNDFFSKNFNSSKNVSSFIVYNKIFNLFDLLSFEVIRVKYKKNIKLYNNNIIFFYIFFNINFWLKQTYYFLKKNKRNINVFSLYNNFFFLNTLLVNYIKYGKITNNLSYFLEKSNLYNNLLLKSYLIKKNIFVLKLIKKIIFFYINLIIIFKYKFLNLFIIFFNMIFFFFFKVKKKRKKNKIKKYEIIKKFFNLFNNRLSSNYFFNFLNINKFNLNLIDNLWKIFQKKNKNKFFLSLQKKLAYAKYSKKNRKNIKKCILYFIQKKTNNFLILTSFKKKKRVLTHASSGYVLTRRYNNSKRQKKGTRVLTLILSKLFKPIIKQRRLKFLYIKTNSLWNFKIRHLTKFWVYRHKLGIRRLNGVKLFYKFPHHKGLRKSNKRRK